MGAIDQQASFKGGEAPISWDIIGGEGLRIIEQIGWQLYRGKLGELAWEPFANTQIDQITKLREKALHEARYTNPHPSEVRARIRDYVRTIREKYSKAGNSPYYAVEGQERGNDLGKKLEIVGRNTPPLGKKKTTRIYMAVDEPGLVSGFEALRGELAASGALDRIELAMNLEVLDNQNPEAVDNNAIVIYVTDSDPNTLTKVAGAIKRAKQKQPVAFKLDSLTLAHVKTESTAEFMIPLDETTSFVEVEKEQGGQSYHSSIFAYMRESVYRGYDVVVNDLPNIATYIYRELEVYTGKQTIYCSNF